MYPFLAVICLLVFLFSLIAKRAERSVFTGPILFLLTGMVLGRSGIGWLTPELTPGTMRALADLTLALLLFADGANSDRLTLKENTQLPIRMLAIGIPGAILLGIAFGFALLPQFDLWQLAILATALAATDAALGKSVVSDSRVPRYLRSTLNVESGLNDGLCVPILLIFIALSLSQHGEEPVMMALALTVQEIGIGLAVGLGVSAIGFHLMSLAKVHGYVNNLWKRVPTVMLALFAFSLAQSLHGSGFIAAFAGGLLFGYLARQRAHHMVVDAEGLGEVLSLTTWFLFGAVVVPLFSSQVTWSIVAYALCCLTFVRMVPVLLSLVGSGVNSRHSLFLAWFGPRGLASVVFAIIIVHEQVEQGREIAVVIACTIFLSVILHGISAAPLVNRFRS